MQFRLSFVVLVLESKGPKGGGTVVLLVASAGPARIWFAPKLTLDETFAIQENPEGPSL